MLRPYLVNPQPAAGEQGDGGRPAPMPATLGGVPGTPAARSSARLPAALRSELPRLLWLPHMGVMLHRVYDRSSGARKSHQLVERVAPLVVKLVWLSRLPGQPGALDYALDLVRALGRD